MAREMTDSERGSFLDWETRTAKLAWVGSDGHPHVAPVWFVRDGDDIVFNTGAATAKGTAIARDARLCLVVDDERPPFAFVKINGVAEVSTDRDAVLRWATLIGARYMGDERAGEFGRRNAVDGELLVRVTPTKVIAQTDVAGY